MNNTIAQQIVEMQNMVYLRQLSTAAGGNISIRDRETVWLTPSGTDKYCLTPESIAKVNIATGEASGKRKPSCETAMHLSVYRARSDVNAIIHAHPLYCSVFSVIDTPLRTDIVSESWILIGKPGYVAGFSPGSSR
ncbi:MAG: class II aldolase/adducin family protein, partial [Candidatus Cloacimonetes bacterium]|nr:class II aldolase/adducin family protein [Candidatus Cloacimonadota bacterium]